MSLNGGGGLGKAVVSMAIAAGLGVKESNLINGDQLSNLYIRGGAGVWGLRRNPVPYGNI